MPITFVSGSGQSKNDGGLETFTKPSNIQEDDLILVWGITRSGGQSAINPNNASWHRLQQNENNGENALGSGQLYMAFRWATASEPANYTFTSGSEWNWALGFVVYRGVDKFSPFQGIFGTINSNTTSDSQPFSIQNVFSHVPGTVVVLGALNHNLNSTPVATFSHATLTNRVNGTGSTDRTTVFAFDGAINSATPVSFTEISSNRGDGNGGTMSFVLRPADKPGRLRIAAESYANGSYSNVMEPASFIVPSVARRGDFLLMYWNSEGTNGELYNPSESGWTNFGAVATGSGRQQGRQGMFGRFWDGKTPSYTFTPTANTWGTTGRLIVIRGVTNMPTSYATAVGSTSPAVTPRRHGFVLRSIVSNTGNNNEEPIALDSTGSGMCVATTERDYRSSGGLFLDVANTGVTRVMSGGGSNATCMAIAFPLDPVHNVYGEGTPPLVFRR